MFKLPACNISEHTQANYEREMINERPNSPSFIIHHFAFIIS